MRDSPSAQTEGAMRRRRHGKFWAYRWSIAAIFLFPGLVIAAYGIQAAV